MNRFVKLLVFLTAVLLLTTHRLPAPISEESPKPMLTPTPTLAPTPTPAATEQSVPSGGVKPTPNGPSSFRGAWTGKINEGKFGDVDLTLEINPEDTALKQ